MPPAPTSGMSAPSPHRPRRYAPGGQVADYGEARIVAEATAAPRRSTTTPSRTVSETLEWVGGDPERARQAVDAELGSSKPRSTLLSALEPLLVDSHTDSDAAPPQTALMDPVDPDTRDDSPPE